jgi:hypothetical protein
MCQMVRAKHALERTRVELAQARRAHPPAAFLFSPWGGLGAAASLSGRKGSGATVTKGSRDADALLFDPVSRPGSAASSRPPSRRPSVVQNATGTWILVVCILLSR